MQQRKNRCEPPIEFIPIKYQTYFQKSIDNILLDNKSTKQLVIDLEDDFTTLQATVSSGVNTINSFTETVEELETINAELQSSISEIETTIESLQEDIENIQIIYNNTYDF